MPVIRRRYLYLLLLLFLILLFGMGAYIISRPTQLQSVTAKGISGTINLNGVVPAGGTITLLQREARTNNPLIPFAANIQPSDQGVWGFAAGESGKSYEIQGAIVQNGTIVYRTSPVFITSPATNESLTFNIPTVTSPNSTPAPSQPATIAGSVGIDGYIPPGATLTLQGRKIENPTYKNVVENIPAQDKQFISYTTAVAGQTYEVKALLFDANQQLIGESAPLTLVAPAYNEELNVNSLAVAPVTPTSIPTATPTPLPTVASTATAVPPTATPVPVPTPTPIVISGSINFNGQAPTNSRIVIFQRVHGTSSYQVALNNVTPADGTVWQWTAPAANTWYDMVAILKQQQSNGTDQDLADSNVITLVAPAANETFTINSGFSLAAPGGPITFNCGTYTSSGQTWAATVTFPSVNNGAAYWYQIGTTNGGSDYSNGTQNSQGSGSQILTEQFQNGKTYYVRYAYATVPNLGPNSTQFSPFSTTFTTTCSQ